MRQLRLGVLASVAGLVALIARGPASEHRLLEAAPNAGPTSAAARARVSPPARPHREPTAPVDSVSCGAANRGSLSDARALPLDGVGYLVPDPWRRRGHRFGTDELVGLIERAAARVARDHPGGTLAVADLSAEQGGAIAGHRSHQSGRDVDLVFFALDDDGAPRPPDQRMPAYAEDGSATSGAAPRPADGVATRWFDLARNWTLVKALLEDPEVGIARIFVSRRVKKWLVSYAIYAGEPEALIARATAMLTRPEDVGGHNDHLHVRITCSDDDVALGRCTDELARRRRRGGWAEVIRCPQPPQPVATARR